MTMRTSLIFALLAVSAAAPCSDTEGECDVNYGGSSDAAEAEEASVSMFQRGASLHDMEVRADGEVVEEAVEVAEPASGERALLTKRGTSKSGNCPYCLCLLESAVSCGTSAVQSAALCGTKTVTDAALCGTKAITDAARCGTSVFKSCGTRRRRRNHNLWKCDFSDVAKSCTVASSCNVATTCNMPKTCNVAQDFSNCLGQITNLVSGAEKSYTSLVTSTGCSSPSSCKRAVNDGLSQGWRTLASGFQGVINSQASSLRAAVGSTRVDNLINTAKTGLKATGSALSAAKTAVTGFFSSLGPFSPYALGSVCASPGFWYMAPTDCGTFDSMADIFSDFGGAATHFNSAVGRLTTCVKKKGLFSVPTPFFALTWVDYCLPSFVTLPISYFMGAMIYVGNAATVIATTLMGIFDKIKAYSDSINLMQLGREYHHKRRTHSNASASDTAGVDIALNCGLEANWAVEFGASFGFTFQNPANPAITTTFEFGFSLLCGCKSNAVIAPNLLLNLQQTAAISLGGNVEPPKPSVSLFVSFFDEYYEFANRVSAAGGASVAPEADLTVIGIPLSASLPIAFYYGEDGYDAPTGFTFALSGEVGAALEQESAALKQAHDEEASPEDQVAAALTSKIMALAESDQLDRALSATVDRTALLETATKLHQHGPQMVRSALARKASTLANETSLLQSEGPPVDLKVGAFVLFQFCVTPGPCYGT